MHSKFLKFSLPQKIQFIIHVICLFLTCTKFYYIFYYRYKKKYLYFFSIIRNLNFLSLLYWCNLMYNHLCPYCSEIWILLKLYSFYIEVIESTFPVLLNVCYLWHFRMWLETTGLGFHIFCFIGLPYWILGYIMQQF